MFEKLKILKGGIQYTPPTEGLERKAAYVCHRLGWSRRDLERNVYAEGVTTLYDVLNKKSRGR